MLSQRRLANVSIVEQVGNLPILLIFPWDMVAVHKHVKASHGGRMENVGAFRGLIGALLLIYVIWLPCACPTGTFGPTDQREPCDAHVPVLGTMCTCGMSLQVLSAHAFAAELAVDVPVLSFGALLVLHTLSFSSARRISSSSSSPCINHLK